MKSKVFRMRVFFLAPLLIAAARVLVTLIILILNPQGMSFRLLQFVPVIVLACSCFSYAKLFNDGDPIVTLMVPTIVHILLILVFKKTLELVPFIVPVILDIMFLTVKGIKASVLPFEFEGEEDEVEDFQDLEVS